MHGSVYFYPSLWRCDGMEDRRGQWLTKTNRVSIHTMILTASGHEGGGFKGEKNKRAQYAFLSF